METSLQCGSAAVILTCVCGLPFFNEFSCVRLKYTYMLNSVYRNKLSYLYFHTYRFHCFKRYQQILRLSNRRYQKGSFVCYYSTFLYVYLYIYCPTIYLIHWFSQTAHLDRLVGSFLVSRLIGSCDSYRNSRPWIDILGDSLVTNFCRINTTVVFCISFI